MIKSGVYNIQLRRGDTGTWQFTATTVDASNPINPITVPINITDWTITGLAKRDQSTVFFQLPITKVDSANGKFQFYIDKETSEDLVPINSTSSDSSSYEIQVSIPNPSEGGRIEVATIITGNFTVARDLVRSRDQAESLWQSI
jgi:hypothetical protein